MVFLLVVDERDYLRVGAVSKIHLQCLPTYRPIIPAIKGLYTLCNVYGLYSSL